MQFRKGIDKDSRLFLAQNCLKIIVEVMNFVQNLSCLSIFQMKIFMRHTKYYRILFACLTPLGRVDSSKLV